MTQSASDTTAVADASNGDGRALARRQSFNLAQLFSTYVTPEIISYFIGALFCSRVINGVDLCRQLEDVLVLPRGRWLVHWRG